MGAVNEGKSYAVAQLQQIRPHHRSMARLFALGHTPGEVAEITGFSPSWISVVSGSPLFQVEVERVTAMTEYKDVNTKRELKELAVVAVEQLARNLHDPKTDRKLATATAFDVLDRTGFGKRKDEKPAQHQHLHLHKRVDEMTEAELYTDVMEMAEVGEEDMVGESGPGEEEEG